MDVWSPSVGDEFALEIGEQKIHDRYVAATKVDGLVVTRKPRFLCGRSTGHFSGTTDLILCKALH